MSWKTQHTYFEAKILRKFAGEDKRKLCQPGTHRLNVLKVLKGVLYGRKIYSIGRTIFKNFRWDNIFHKFMYHQDDEVLQELCSE